MKNEDKVGTKNMAEEMYAIGKGTKIDENLNEATQRKCIGIKAFAPCRFSRIKIYFQLCITRFDLSSAGFD